MEDFKTLVGLLDLGNGTSWGALGVGILGGPYFIAITASKHLAPFLGLLHSRRDSQLEKIDAYLSKSEQASPAIKAVAVEVRDTVIFRLATGLQVDSKLCAPYIVLHERTSPAVGWSQIRIARDFLQFDASKGIVVNDESLSDKLFLMFSRLCVLFFASVFVVCTGLTATLLATAIANQDGTGVGIKSLLVGLGGFVAWCLTLAGVSQMRPILTARVIRKELAALRAALPPA